MEKYVVDLSKLIHSAQLDFGFASGTGLGAILLAIVLVVLFLSTKLSGRNLADLVAAFQKQK